MKPLCVLDFFVDSSVQRGGHGKHLFDTMLQHQNAQPQKLAYD
jgi:alpha-tubulin N-acetyltransferase 1